MRALLVFLVVAALGRGADSFELVLRGGWVMDPASGLSARRDVAIAGGRIAAVSAELLTGRRVIDVSDRGVAPGFIDLHIHGVSTADLSLKACDGVTTALELERGAHPIAGWYAWMAGRSPVNYGAAVSHRRVRVAAFRPELAMAHDDPMMAVSATLPAAREREVQTMEKLFREGLDAGALAVGFGLEYTPAVDGREIEALYKIAAERRVPVFMHTRASGSMAAIEEAIAPARKAGASLHIVHIVSSSRAVLPDALSVIDPHRKAGMDLTTETYPYTAASTRLESAMFNPGWEQRLGIGPADLMWPATGERLTPETFASYRRQGGFVVIHSMKEENVERALAHPGVIVGSDSMPFIDGKAHPRGAGTFARVLARYVRERGTLDLMDALAKMTILPARRMDHVPAMGRKGRITVGADADLTIFDPKTVADQATFEDPMRASKGIYYVLVRGTVVVDNGALVKTVMPGQPIRLHSP